MNNELYDKYKDAPKRNLTLLVSAPRTRPELKEVAAKILAEREALEKPAAEKPKPAAEKTKPVEAKPKKAAKSTAIEKPKKTTKAVAEKPKPAAAKKVTAKPEKAAKKAPAKEAPTTPEKVRRPKVDTVTVKLHSKGKKPSGNDPRGSLLTIFKNEDKPKDVSFDSINIGDKVEDPKRSYKGTVIRLCYYSNKKTFTFARVQSLTNAQTILLLSTKRLKKLK